MLLIDLNQVDSFFRNEDVKCEALAEKGRVNHQSPLLFTVKIIFCQLKLDGDVLAGRKVITDDLLTVEDFQ